MHFPRPGAAWGVACWASLAAASSIGGCSSDAAPPAAAVAGGGAGAASTAGAAGAVSTAGSAASAGSAAAGQPGAGGSGGVNAAGAGGSAGAAAGAGGSAAGAGARSFSTNRNDFFGASRCAAAGVQFCEDFESGTLDTATWKVGGTVPVIDSLQAARGTKALHFALTGNGNTHVSESKTFPAMNAKYWGRAFVYFNAMPHHSADADSLDYSHWTILAATGKVVAGEVRIGGQLQKRFGGATPLNYFGVGTDNRTQPEGSGDWTNADNDPADAAKPVTEKQWSCLEWMHDSQADETKFFLDGVEHPSLATTPMTKHGGIPDKPFLLPEIDALWFGFAEYQPTTQKLELWYDEIALDPERVGCAI